jgi:hypothetical protein
MHDVALLNSSSYTRDVHKAVETCPQLIPPGQGHFPQYAEEIQVDLLPLYILSYTDSSDNYIHTAQGASCLNPSSQTNYYHRLQTARSKKGMYD